MKKNTKTQKQLDRIDSLLDEIFQLRNMIDNIPSDVYWKNVDGTWAGVNQRGADSLIRMGFINHRDEVLGKTDHEIFDKNTADIYRHNDLEVMNSRKEYTSEESVKLRNGQKLIQLSIKRPFENKKGEIAGIVGSTIDISHLKQIESELTSAKNQAESASHAKTEFLENMRHDIRTPLTGIVGFSDIIKTEAKSPKIKEYADNLIASSHALLELMDEVLEAIRVGSGEISKSEHKFSLEKTMQHVINLNKAKALSKHIKLMLEYDDYIPKYIISDNVRIHRIALELVANALNFTDHGSVTLKLELAKEENRELIIKLSVIDTGIGIPKEKQNIIFQQFKRLTPAYQGVYKGAGLGLSIIKQFVDEINAEIYVKSTPKEGSTFSCIIPVKKPLLEDDEYIDNQFDSSDLTPESGALPKPQLVDKTCDKKNTHNILVVEDSIIAQSIAKAMLSQCYCNVTIAETGIQAQEMWLQHQYDLIFMDIGLPDIDGYEVTHFIRLKEASTKKHTPIVALTAHIGTESKKRCIEAGMNAVLSKPLTKDVCIKVLDSFIPSRVNAMTLEQVQYAKDLPNDDQELFNLIEFPTFDIKQGIETTGGKDMLKQMIELMLNKTLENDLKELTDAHQNQNWEQAQKIAHKIKGGIVYVGATRLKVACQYIERYYKAGQRKHLEKLYEQVMNVSNETISEFKDYLQSEG